MRYLILLVVLWVGCDVHAQPGCRENPNIPWCPVLLEQVEDGRILCAAYSRSLSANPEKPSADSVGAFLQAFPVEKCNSNNQSTKEQELFLFKAETSTTMKAVGFEDSLISRPGRPDTIIKVRRDFAMVLTKQEEEDLRQRGRKTIDRSVALKRVERRRLTEEIERVVR